RRLPGRPRRRRSTTRPSRRRRRARRRAARPGVARPGIRGGTSGLTGGARAAGPTRRDGLDVGTADGAGPRAGPVPVPGLVPGSPVPAAGRRPGPELLLELADARLGCVQLGRPFDQASLDLLEVA